jgi:HD superfamily phosphodiesterase
MARLFYVGYSYMGTNFSYDSFCWKVYAFDSKKARREWLDDNTYDRSSNNIVAEPIDRQTAYRILKFKKNMKIRFDKQENYSILSCDY